MPLITSKKIKPLPRRPRRQMRKSATPSRKPAASVRIVRPKGTQAVRARARRLAKEVRRELSAHEEGTLDEAMLRLRCTLQQNTLRANYR